MNHAALSAQAAFADSDSAGLPKLNTGDEQGGLPIPAGGSSGRGWKTDAQGRAVRQKPSSSDELGSPARAGMPLLTCEPLPEDADEIHDFVKRWLTGGEADSTTSESASETVKPETLRRKAQARAVDAIVWTDDWEVKRPWAPFAFGLDIYAQTGSDTAQGRSSSSWSTEEARYHLLTALLPFLLKSPPDRSVRLVSLVSPFYAAAMAAERSLAEQRKRDDAPEAQGPIDAATLPVSADDQSAKITASPVLESGRRGLRTALLWLHLQKVLDAVATATAHAQGLQAGAAPKVDDAGVAKVSENIEQLRVGLSIICASVCLTSCPLSSTADRGAEPHQGPSRGHLPPSMGHREGSPWYSRRLLVVVCERVDPVSSSSGRYHSRSALTAAQDT